MFTRIDLLNAIDNSDSITVQQLITSGQIAVNERLPRDNAPRDNAPALVLAARAGRQAVVELLLLNCGAHVDATDRSGHTACHAAVERDDAALLAVLLTHGPNLTLKNNDNQTPLDIALQRRCESTVTSLLAVVPLPLENRRHVCQAAAMSTEAIETLVKRGVAIGELRDNAMSTPLHYGVASVDVLNALVGVYGVDVNATNSYGDTAVHSAVDGDKDEQLRWLFNAGADLEIVNRLGFSPLHNSCINQGVQCTLLLLAMGVDLNRVTNVGWSACHLVVNRGYLVKSTIKTKIAALVSEGANLDEPSPTRSASGGATPRQTLAERAVVMDDELVRSAHRSIAKLRLDLVRSRALQICIGLQSLELDALCTCEILQFACGPVAALVKFHQWWAIATAVKHCQR